MTAFDDLMAAVGTAVGTYTDAITGPLLQQLAALGAQVQTLQTQLAAAEANDAATQQALAAALAEIAALQAQLAGLQCQVGIDISLNAPSTASTYAGEVAAARVLFNTLGDHTKCFSTGNIKAAMANRAAMGLHADERHQVVCFKSIDPADINNAFASLTEDTWFVYMQESNRICPPATTTAGYKQVDALRKAHPNGARVKLLLNLSTYREVMAPQPGERWQDYALPLQGILDGIGGDAYATPDLTLKWNPAQQLGWLVTASHQMGIPWCVPEHGVMVPTGGSEADAAKAYTDTVAYCRANGCAWLNYWWSSGGFNWRHPADSPLTAALRADVAAGAGR